MSRPETATRIDTIEAVRRVVAKMRAKERELWEGKPPRMGCAAVALMLDGLATDLAVAIGDCPPPKGRAKP